MVAQYRSVCAGTRSARRPASSRLVGDQPVHDARAVEDNQEADMVWTALLIAKILVIALIGLGVLFLYHRARPPKH